MRFSALNDLSASSVNNVTVPTIREIYLGSGVTMRLVWIEGGQFLMGSPQNELARESDEGPQHWVRLSGFWMGETTVTQAQWIAVMGTNPSKHVAGTLIKKAGMLSKLSGKSDELISSVEAPNLPVENVTWNDIMGRQDDEDAKALPGSFIARLSQRLGLPGVFRLPREAEWEFACRAGTTGPFSFGNQLSPDVANYNSSYPCPCGSNGGYRARPVPVKSLPANPWGLFEMHGNVWEWCNDWYGAYGEAETDNPRGGAERLMANVGGGPMFWAGGYWERVLRGGSWTKSASCARSACRDHDDPCLAWSDTIGFRVVYVDPDSSANQSQHVNDSYIEVVTKNVPGVESYMISSPRSISIVQVQLGSKAGERLELSFYDTVRIAFRWCPPGVFTMGAPSRYFGFGGEKKRCRNEKQIHVRLSRGFWLGETPITVAQYKCFVQATGYRTNTETESIISNSWKNPEFQQGDTHPVTNLSWDDALAFCNWTGLFLPTEAQWEYACRAGTVTRFYSGNEDSDLDRVGWYVANSGLRTHPVGEKPANAWGLKDMHGNVSEWCSDLYGYDRPKANYPTDLVTDPMGVPRYRPAFVLDEAYRVHRGGSYNDLAETCRSASRSYNAPSADFYGFRVLLAV